MPSAPAPDLPTDARRRWPATAAVAAVALLGLGSAVAGGYGTGLALGTRMGRPGEALDPHPHTPAARPEPRREPGGDDDVTVDPASPEATTVPSSPTPSGTLPGHEARTTTTVTNRVTTAVPPPTTPDPGPVPTSPSEVPDQSAPLRPPDDAVEATHQLVKAAAAGEVDHVWELLTPSARSAVGDRLALAARLTDLHDRLAPMRGGAALGTTELSTHRGLVTVVAPIVDPGRAPIVLPFVDVGGRPRLAAIDPPPDVRWTAPSDDRTDLVVGGAHRPTRVAVDGVALPGVPDEPEALRVPVAALPEGSHRAVAVFVSGRQVTASAFEFTTPPRRVDEPGVPPVPPPPGVDPDVAPAATPSSAPAP